jgi:hypothetical protein
MPSFKISDFVASSKSYVKSAVRNANTDGNAYLTKAEAKALPKDLKDNFETHRVLAQDNARVSVSKFTTNYPKYVAVQARAADANGDGILSAAEQKKLPKDLRDNAANFNLFR